MRIPAHCGTIHSRPTLESCSIPGPACYVLLTWPCPVLHETRPAVTATILWRDQQHRERRNGKKWGGNIHGMIDGSWLWLTNPFSCVCCYVSIFHQRLGWDFLQLDCAIAIDPLAARWFVGWRCRGPPVAGFISGTPPPAVVFFHLFHPSVRLFLFGGSRDDRHGLFFLFIAATHCNSPLMYRCVCGCSTASDISCHPSTSFLTTVPREREMVGATGHTHHRISFSLDFSFWWAFLSATRKKSILYQPKTILLPISCRDSSLGGNPWLPSASGELLTKIPGRRKKKRENKHIPRR